MVQNLSVIGVHSLPYWNKYLHMCLFRFASKYQPKLVASTVHVKFSQSNHEKVLKFGLLIFSPVVYAQAAYSDHIASVWTKVAEDTKEHADRSS